MTTTTSKFTQDQFITVVMSTRVNDIKLQEDPPLLQTDISDDYRRQQVSENIQGVAKWWDIYRDIVQLSFYHSGHAFHYLLCDDPDRTITGGCEETIGRTTYRYDDEEALIRGAFEFIHNAFGPETADGSPLYMRTLIGWRMYIEIWPILVNRAVKYRIPIYKDMLTDLDKKWPTTKHLADVASIYLQGGGGFRKLPGLAELLRFWGVLNCEHKPLPEDMALAVCSDTVNTIEHIEVYLRGMMDIIQYYYRTEVSDTDICNPLAGLAVPTINTSSVVPAMNTSSELHGYRRY